MNTTPIPTVITVIHKNVSNNYYYVVYLLLTSFLSHETHFKAKADICLYLHSLKYDDGFF